MTRGPGTSPVITIGMHRSGTSMLAGKLQDAGLFGWRQQVEHHEAVSFQGLNDWLLQQAGSSSNHPALIGDLIRSAEARAVAASYLRYSLHTSRASSYLGPWPRLRSSDAMRHGVDVARRLQVRSEAIGSTRRQHFERNKWQYSLWRKRSGFTRGLRFSSIEHGLELWDDYTTEARRQVAELGDRAHELHYESILSEPVERMAKLMEFCGLGSPTPDLRAPLASVGAGRALAYGANPELAALPGRQQAQLARHGC